MKTALKSFALSALVFLFSVSANTAQAAKNKSIVETSEDTVALEPAPKSIELDVSPFSYFYGAYNMGVYFPLSPKFLIGPKATLFNDNRADITRRRKGSQIGVRAQYFVNRTFQETGLVLKGGIFRDNYTDHTWLYDRSGKAEGLMFDLQVGVQIDAGANCALSASLGLESFNWKDGGDPSFYFDHRSGRRVGLVSEINIAFLL